MLRSRTAALVAIVVPLALSVAGLILLWGHVVSRAPSHVAPVYRASKPAVESGPTLEGRGGTSSSVTEGLGHPDPTQSGQAGRRAWVSSIRGQVADARGKPVPGARLRLLLRRGRVLSALKAPVPDEAGRFEIDLGSVVPLKGVHRGTAELLVEAIAPGHRTGAPLEVPLSLESDTGVLEASLVLEAGVVATGRVVDREGALLRGVWVELRPISTKGRTHLAKTDASGWYVASADAEGRYELSVAGGWAETEPATHYLRMDAVNTLPDLVAWGRCTTSGRVIGPAGAPLAGVDLQARPLHNEGGNANRVLYAHSGADGKFEFFTNTSVTYSVSMVGMQRQQKPVQVEAGDSDVLVRVRTPVMLVRVADEDGLPVPGARVTMTAWREVDAPLLRMLQSGKADSEQVRQAASRHVKIELRHLDAQYAFGVAPGEVWRVAATAPGATVAESVVSVGQESDIEVVKLQLRVASPAVKASLRVTGPDGVRLRRFRIESRTILGSLRGAFRGGVDSGGSSIWIPARTRRIRVVPNATGRVPTPREAFTTYLMPAERVVGLLVRQPIELAVQLQRGGRFRLRLLWPPGVPSDGPDVEVFVVRSVGGHEFRERAPWWAYDSARGPILRNKYYWRSAPVNTVCLEAGVHLIRVRVDGHGSYDRTVQIRRGRVVDVNVKLSR